MPGKKTDNKVKIAPAPVTPANVLVDIAMIVDVIPREKHDDLAAILEKALFKDPLIHAKGSATLLLQLGRRAHVHAPTREED